MIGLGPRLRAVAGLFVLAVLIASSARAESAVDVGGARALLELPAAPKGSLILVPGGDGVLDIKADGSFAKLAGNQLVRTRAAYARHGLATLTVDRGVDLGAAIEHMRAIASPVVVVATSRGSLRIPAALAKKPDGIVLTSAFLDAVSSKIGNSSRLPPTLVVHHRGDGCHHTPPSGVAPFKAWGGERVSVQWMEGGRDEGDPCQARGHHGFAGIDGDVVAKVSAFALALKR